MQDVITKMQTAEPEEKATAFEIKSLREWKGALQ